MNRRNFIQSALVAGASMSGLRPALAQTDAATKGTIALNHVQDWDKTFSRSDKVDHQKVTFKNRYGIDLAADLYLPKSSGAQHLPALAVSGPFGAVKEQVSGLYAQSMAERGYVTLAFDPSYIGESGGEPRNMPSPEINTEDFSAAVDFLGLQPYVNRHRIGIIGICGFGGMGLSAAAVDKRIKAVVVSSMYDMSRVLSKGYFDQMALDQRTKILEQLGEQRWIDAANGAPSPGQRALPVTKADVASIADPVLRKIVDMYFDYYRTPRGFHPRSPNSNGAWTATGVLPFMNLPLLTHIAEISPRPILLIAGENAHSRYFSEDAYVAAAEPKELLLIKDCVHVDLYDRADMVPFDRISEFFVANLKED